MKESTVEEKALVEAPAEKETFSNAFNLKQFFRVNGEGRTKLFYPIAAPSPSGMVRMRPYGGGKDITTHKGNLEGLAESKLPLSSIFDALHEFTLENLEKMEGFELVEAMGVEMKPYDAQKVFGWYKELLKLAGEIEEKVS